MVPSNSGGLQMELVKLHLGLFSSQNCFSVMLQVSQSVNAKTGVVC